MEMEVRNKALMAAAVRRSRMRGGGRSPRGGRGGARFLGRREPTAEEDEEEAEEDEDKAEKEEEPCRRRISELHAAAAHEHGPLLGSLLDALALVDSEAQSQTLPT